MAKMKRPPGSRRGHSLKWAMFQPPDATHDDEMLPCLIATSCQPVMLPVVLLIPIEAAREGVGTECPGCGTQLEAKTPPWQEAMEAALRED